MKMQDLPFEVASLCESDTAHLGTVIHNLTQ